MNAYYLEFDDERSGGFASCEIGNKLIEEEQWAKLALVKEIAEEVWAVSFSAFLFLSASFFQPIVLLRLSI